MQHILTIIWGYVSLHKDGIIAIAIPGGVLLSTGVQWFLHRFKVNGPVVSFVISHLFAAATAASAYILDAVHPNAAVTYGWIWIASQFWHRFAVNPAYNKYVLPFLGWLAQQKVAKATAGVPPTTPDQTESVPAIDGLE